MKRILVFLFFSAIVFFAGLVAGKQIFKSTIAYAETARSVRTESGSDLVFAPDEAIFVEASTACQREDTAENVQIARSEDDAFIVTASLSDSDSDLVGLSHRKESSSSHEDTKQFSVAEGHVTTPESITAGHQAVLELIQQMLPGTDAETSAIWAESYSGMDLADVQFILEQKQSLASATGSMTHLNAPLPKPENVLLLATTQNLRSSMSIGFRRQIVLPEAATDSGIVLRNPNVMYRSFESGRVVSSPIPSHVALKEATPQHMFLLQNNVVTRRGDFRRLPDGTIGLLVSDREYPIANSPSGLSAETVIEIDETGMIFSRTQSSEKVQHGRLTVVSINNLSALESSDGVLFTTRTAPTPIAESEVVVHAGHLELSNVDVVEEAKLRSLVLELRANQF